MKRVLIVGFTGNYGGLESYVMQIYRHIDHSILQFDFVTLEDSAAYSSEIISMGGRVFYVPIKRKNVKEHYRKINQIFSETKYAGIYYQSNHKLQTMEFFKFAKKYHVPMRVLHSHNSCEESVSWITHLRKKAAELQMDRFVNYRFACSKEAGEWMFPNRSFSVIPNSVDADQFDFCPKVRQTVREELGCQKKYVIGSVGRMTDVKNPYFMIEIMKEVHKADPNTVFYHVGDGDLREEVQKRIDKEGLGDFIFLLGRKENVPDYMNAMDVFLLPSIHEGFPMVLVEAQISGLSCIAADNIPKECNLSGQVFYLPIDQGAAVWKDKILELKGTERSSNKDIVVSKGYDINNVARKMQDFFTGASEWKEY